MDCLANAGCCVLRKVYYLTRFQHFRCFLEFWLLLSAQIEKQNHFTQQFAVASRVRLAFRVGTKPSGRRLLFSRFGE